MNMNEQQLSEPIKRNDPIDIARKKPSLARCLRAYLWQHHGVRENTGCDGVNGSELRKAARDDYRRLRIHGLRRIANDVCFNCAGGQDSVDWLDPAVPGGVSSSGGDFAAKERVRDCRMTDCALHPVRGWQKIKGRGSRPEIDGEAADETEEGEEPAFKDV